jgi:hypothetical protein
MSDTTNVLRMTREALAPLVEAEIVEFRGVSGVSATLDQAFDMPDLCLMHSSAGNVYDLKREGRLLVATKRNPNQGETDVVKNTAVDSQ